MMHVYNLTDIHLMQPSVVTIGVFDGVHRGHQELIKQLVQTARNTDRLAVVLTFFPHPDIVLRGLTGRYYLMHPDQRAEALIALGVDAVVTHPFDDEVRQIRAETFVDQLIDHLKLKELWVGSDFAMGYRREGNVTFLTEQGKQKDFDVHAIDLVKAEKVDDAITSTMIRHAVEHGNVEQAKEWMGRSYALRGEVVHGLARGRTIGFPTANIALWDQQVIPLNGVYAGWATLENGQRYMAVTNVGVRPTFDGSGITVEAHLLDFEGDLYGQQLSFSFERWLRGEKRFSGIEELVAQIRSDADTGRLALSS